MIHAPRIHVIVGSVRRQRICPLVAEWVMGVGREAMAAAFEIVDLRDWPLPMDDEPGVPAGHPYEQPHTLAWSRKVQEAQAFVFVTPQYNWGYPASLKNALDHLYREWNGKPAMIVTYGGHGGDKCAGQLRQVLDGLKMNTVATMPGFRISREQVEQNSGAIDPAAAFAAHLPELRQGFAELQAALA